MRPSTLFGKKFDDYLNANNLAKHLGKRVEAGTDWKHKKIDMQSGIPTDTLQDLFKNLDDNLDRGISIGRNLS